MVSAWCSFSRLAKRCKEQFLESYSGIPREYDRDPLKGTLLNPTSGSL